MSKPPRGTKARVEWLEEKLRDAAKLTKAEKDRYSAELVRWKSSLKAAEKEEGS